MLPLMDAEVLDRYGCAGNQEVLSTCRKHPDRLIPFCSVDPRSMLNLLTIYRDLGCKGIGEVCGAIPVDMSVMPLFTRPPAN